MVWLGEEAYWRRETKALAPAAPGNHNCVAPKGPPAGENPRHWDLLRPETLIMAPHRSVLLQTSLHTTGTCSARQP